MIDRLFDRVLVAVLLFIAAFLLFVGLPAILEGTLGAKLVGGAFVLFYVVGILYLALAVLLPYEPPPTAGGPTDEPPRFDSDRSEDGSAT